MEDTVDDLLYNFTYDGGSNVDMPVWPVIPEVYIDCGPFNDDEGNHIENASIAIVADGYIIQNITTDSNGTATFVLSKPEFDGVVGAEIADKLREIKTIMRDFYLESATGNESEDKR